MRSQFAKNEKLNRFAWRNPNMISQRSVQIIRNRRWLRLSIAGVLLGMFLTSPSLPITRPKLIQYPPPEIRVPFSQAELEKRCSQNPQDIEAHFYLMCLYAQQKRWQDSLRVGQIALRSMPNDVNIHMVVIYAQANLGQHREALSQVERSLRQSYPEQPFAIPALFRLKGDLLMDEYRRTRNGSVLKQAERSYRQALQRDSTHLHSHIGLARVAIERKQWNEAKRHLNKVINSDRPTEAGYKRRQALAYYYLGVISEAQRQFKQADSYYRKAVQTHPPSFVEGAKVRAAEEFIGFMGEALFFVLIGLEPTLAKAQEQWLSALARQDWEVVATAFRNLSAAESFLKEWHSVTKSLGQVKRWQVVISGKPVRWSVTPSSARTVRIIEIDLDEGCYWLEVEWDCKIQKNDKVSCKLDRVSLVKSEKRMGS